MSRKAYFTMFVIVVLALAWCIPSLGQVIKGSISGTVVDPQGAVVSGAQVKATNVETGAAVNATTDSSGLFRFNLLPVGTYNIEITAQGFKKATHGNVAVSAGVDTGLGSMKMFVGETSQTIEVVAEAPLIEASQSQISTTFSGTSLTTFAGVQENEGLDNLALFVPGVNSSRSQNFSNTNGASISSNGLRGRNNDQEIDGQNNNDNSVGGPGLFVSDAEFVQQYVAITNQFGPEYGRNSGSVINIITKSGANAWHGAVFGTETSNFLTALSNSQRQFAFKADGVTPISGPPRFNDEFTGFTLGGPMVKNKWFIFGGFDNEIFSGNNVFTGGTLVPSTAGLATLNGCFPASQSLVAYNNFGPLSISAGNPTILSPRNLNVGACTNVQFGLVQRTLPGTGHAFDFPARIDGQIGSSDNLSVRYLFNRNNNFNATGTGSTGYIGNVPALSQMILLSETHSFSSRMVNEARVGFGRLNVEFGGNSFGNTIPTADSLNQALARIDFNSTFSSFGPATNLPQARIVNTWQVQDNWNYVLGRHTLKAGVNWTYQRSPNIFLPNINGRYRFTNFLSYVNNTPNTITIGNGPSSLDFREYDTFLYFGDDWKISQSLTLNLGITWSDFGQPYNIFNSITTQRESGSGGFWNPALPLSVRTFPTIPAYKKAFGPSVGFAYSPQWGGWFTGNGKTVLRGGYRIAYDPAYYNIYINAATAAPEVFLQTFTGAAAASKPMPANPHGPQVRAALAPFITPGVLDPRTQSQTNVTPNFSPDNAQLWSFGAERELTKNSAFEARYVGNHGGNQFQSIDGNPFIAALAAAYPQFTTGLTPCPATQQIGPGAGSDVGRVNCGTGVIRTRGNSGYSDYHALQTEFRANNLFKQLTMRTGYTWSKATDNTSEIFSTGTAGNSVAISQNPLSFKSAEHGTSGLDFPSNFYADINWQLPFFRDQHGAIGHVLGGWQVSGTYRYASGQSFTPVQIVEATLTGGNFYDSTFYNTFFGNEPARPFLGSNSAPLTQVGIFCGDAAALFGISCAGVGGNNQLVSLNAINGTPSTVVAVSQNQVRFIENTGIAQKLFGTPFGNVGRNTVRDAITNVVNFSVVKNFKIGEKMSFEARATALNALNHFNFGSVDPVLLDAGLRASGTGFGDPTVTGANGRRLFVGGIFRF